MMPKKCKCGKNSQFPANLAKFLQLIVARSSIGGANLPPWSSRHSMADSQGCRLNRAATSLLLSSTSTNPSAQQIRSPFQGHQFRHQWSGMLTPSAQEQNSNGGKVRSARPLSVSAAARRAPSTAWPVRGPPTHTIRRLRPPRKALAPSLAAEAEREALARARLSRGGGVERWRRGGAADRVGGRPEDLAAVNFVKWTLVWIVMYQFSK